MYRVLKYMKKADGKFTRVGFYTDNPFSVHVGVPYNYLTLEEAEDTAANLNKYAADEGRVKWEVDYSRTYHPSDR